jgi:hypothetical protein
LKLLIYKFAYKNNFFINKIYLGKPGRARLGPLNGPLGRPAKLRPIALASLRVRAPALLAACWAAREGLARKPVLALILLPPDWKVGIFLFLQSKNKNIYLIKSINDFIRSAKTIRWAPKRNSRARTRRWHRTRHQIYIHYNRKKIL